MPSPAFAAKLAAILARRDELAALMSEGDADIVGLSKEYAELRPVAEAVERYHDADQELAELATLMRAPDTEPEMKALVEAEVNDLRAQLPQLEHAVRLALLPKDEADDKNAIMEIRPGAGGDEAALFAGDLANMYQRYAALRGWRIETLSLAENDLGGLREWVCSIKGQGVFARLKYESGTHRVQRVPTTETQGRIHTSTATVAILPEVEDIDVEINEATDLRVDVFRAQGAGGQHVNTTDSAVRITHLPSGIVVSMQDEKSQHKNRAKAMKVLRARLYEQQRQARDAERAADRKGQVGTGDRSERIRTYNFPQGRCTDHRINLTLYKLDNVINGEALDEVIDPLIAEDQAAALADLAS